MSTYSIGKPVFVCQMRYGGETWEQVAWFRYFDQAQLFLGAMQRRWGGWDMRLIELDSTEANPSADPVPHTEAAACAARIDSQSPSSSPPSCS